MWTSATVRKVLGVSQRQLDYWEESGLILASANEKRARRELTRAGRLEQRKYEFVDILGVRLVKQLRDAGLSLQKIRKAADELRRQGKSLNAVLVTDGKKVEWIREDGRVQQLLAGGQLVFAAVALKRIEIDLRKKLRIDMQGRPVKATTRKRARAS